ncbi:MAG: ketopantoate reductase family protein [Anaerolineae bacterium]|nr:ketopantoate reductase family protein [Anaerolineae bacterium]
MPEIERVAILGAGAIGAYFATRFFETPGFSTGLIAGGARGGRLRRDGLVVNDKVYQMPVLDPAAPGPPADLILVAVKHHHLPEAVHDLKHLVGDETKIVSMMNGLDSEETIGALYGRERVLYGVCVGIDALREGNRVTYTVPGKHYFGEATNDPPGERVRRVQAAFQRAGIRYETPADMMRVLWWKFMVNVSMNPPSAVMRAPYGVFQSSPDAQVLMETLMREVIALAQAEGVALGEQDIADWYAVLPTLAPAGKTSMHQDVEAGRPTEIEMFAGKVVALGEKHGIATPGNEMMLRMVRAIEEQVQRTSEVRCT